MSSSIRVISGENFQQCIQAGEHTLIADEPASIGGDNTGPDPYTLLLASLGACTNITLQMYARRKGWPLERVEVESSHAKVHADDCQECEGRDGRVDRIERNIRITGDLDAEQIKRLGEIAKRCPVHQTLEAGSVVVDSIDSTPVR